MQAIASRIAADGPIPRSTPTLKGMFLDENKWDGCAIGDERLFSGVRCQALRADLPKNGEAGVSRGSNRRGIYIDQSGVGLGASNSIDTNYIPVFYRIILAVVSLSLQCCIAWPIRQ